MEDWFRFFTRAWFRLSPGPGWQWPVMPPAPPDRPDAPTPGWPTPEYTALTDALAVFLTDGGPTLNYEDPEGGGPRSLTVISARTEVPSGPDETGTALAAGTIIFETSCFVGGRGVGPGQRLGDWLALREFSHEGGDLLVQLDEMQLTGAQWTGGGGEGEGWPLCEIGGGPLYVRSAAQPIA